MNDLRTIFFYFVFFFCGFLASNIYKEWKEKRKDKDFLKLWRRGSMPGPEWINSKDRLPTAADSMNGVVALWTGGDDYSYRLVDYDHIPKHGFHEESVYWKSLWIDE